MTFETKSRGACDVTKLEISLFGKLQNSTFVQFSKCPWSATVETLSDLDFPGETSNTHYALRAVEMRTCFIALFVSFSGEIAWLRYNAQ